LIFLRVFDLFGPEGIEIDIDHDLQEVTVRFDAWRLEPVHDHLAPPLESLVDSLCKKGIYDSEKGGELFFGA
jgi:hypothetical protein